VRTIEDARSACDEHRWGDAWRLLSAIPASDLDVDDLDRLATAGYLIGHDEEAFRNWTQAHQRCVDAGALHRAAHFGVKLAQCLGFKADLGRCRGWVERTARVLEQAGIDCVEQGYLEYGLGMLRLFEAGDIPGAHGHFVRAGKVAARFAHHDLTTQARIGEGRMLVYLGELSEGMALLDEAMVSIEAGELSTLAAGDGYCTVIDACAELFDLARWRSWTESFTRWCDGEQELVLYRGHCFLHRAEVLGLLGQWGDALGEARHACDRLAAPVNPGALGAACAIEGDLLRLSGDLGGADAAYQRASIHGHDPQPGLALLRLAQDRAEASLGMIRRALGETVWPIGRARLLAATVEIELAVGDHALAKSAMEELHVVGRELASPLLRAHAASAAGAVLLKEGDDKAALVELRRAFNQLNRLGLRHDAAKARLLIAQACSGLGDNEAAAMERAAAHATLEALQQSVHATTPAPPDGLTARELEVLRLLAQGKTNRVIAGELIVSEKTVASHVSHIFTKLGVASRSAATAYAYDHDLV